jgi:folylpolyglutamate synthase/dihydropteroate synthase
VACAPSTGDITDDAIRRGLASTEWPGRLQLIAEHPRVILDGGHNPAALTRAGASLRALIDGERLVALFGMLTERDPVQILAALRSMHPDAAVFTAAESAGTHAIPATHLAEVYGSGGEAVAPAAAALARARELAGTNGNVIVCGSLYLVGEILALHQDVPQRDVG